MFKILVGEGSSLGIPTIHAIDSPAVWAYFAYEARNIGYGHFDNHLLVNPFFTPLSRCPLFT
jgi:hypothetical protein